MSCKFIKISHVLKILFNMALSNLIFWKKGHNYYFDTNPYLYILGL